MLLRPIGSPIFAETPFTARSMCRWNRPPLRPVRSTRIRAPMYRDARPGTIGTRAPALYDTEIGLSLTDWLSFGRNLPLGYRGCSAGFQDTPQVYPARGISLFRR